MHRRRRLGDDTDLVVFTEVPHHDVEHESIELRFGQRIRSLELDPFDANASAVLGRQALSHRDPELAARWFRAALAAGPADRAAAHCDLAESYLGASQPVLAKRQVLAALENAPMYARAQDLLLAIVDGVR